jgi:phage shock protein E
MKKSAVSILLLASLGFWSLALAEEGEFPNKLIDYQTFRREVYEVDALQASRTVSVEKFLAMAGEPNTVILDARSARMFEGLHVDGAVNLDYSEFTAETLAKVIPSKDTRILIYCNNNFLREKEFMATKVAPASLNIHTFVTLFSYGYKNVYQLGPLVDGKKTSLPLVRPGRAISPRA